MVGDVLVAEEVLDLADVHAGVEEYRCCRSVEGILRLDAGSRNGAVPPLIFLECAWLLRTEFHQERPEQVCAEKANQVERSRAP